jgi:hypothetical protein
MFGVAVPATIAPPGDVVDATPQELDPLSLLAAQPPQPPQASPAEVDDVLRVYVRPK